MFEPGKKYKTRDGEVLTFLAEGITRLVFQTKSGGIEIRLLSGKDPDHVTSALDVLPEEIVEPLEWEGEGIVLDRCTDFDSVVCAIHVPECLNGKKFHITLKEIVE